MPVKQYTRVAFTTYHGPTDYAPISRSPLVYLIVAEEVCPTTGRLHHQGYMESQHKVLSVAKVKTLLNDNTAHVEKALGNCEANQNYVRKGAGYTGIWKEHKLNHPTYGHDLRLLHEWGTAKQQGKRNDLEAIAQSIHEGKRLRDIAEENPAEFIKFHKGIQAYKSAITKPRSADTPKEVFVYFGPTGTNKTRTAHEAYPDAHIQGNELGKWFDGYDGHSEVILDEYRGQLTFGFLLRLLDRYPMKVEVKGGVEEFVADTIIITCPEHPSTWYKTLDQRDGKMDQLRRRITKIMKFEKDAPPVDVTHEEWDSGAFDPSFQF